MDKQCQSILETHEQRNTPPAHTQSNKDRRVCYSDILTVTQDSHILVRCVCVCVKHTDNVWKTDFECEVTETVSTSCARSTHIIYKCMQACSTYIHVSASVYCIIPGRYWTVHDGYSQASQGMSCECLDGGTHRWSPTGSDHYQLYNNYSTQILAATYMQLLPHL